MPALHFQSFQSDTLPEGLGVRWGSFMIGGMEGMQAVSQAGHGSDFMTVADSPWDLG